MIIITCGLVKGYNNSKDPEWDLIDVVLKKMAQEVPFTFCFKKVLYNQEWGCPANGEHIVEISAMCNPKFEPDYNKWVQKYERFAKELSLILRQSTAFIDDYTEPVFKHELSLVKERDKYTYLQIEEYVQEWAKDNRNQRLGQWFYNNYDNSGEPFPELFYESSIKKALDLIYENYLK